jgi:hypothetical protein
MQTTTRAPPKSNVKRYDFASITLPLTTTFTEPPDCFQSWTIGYASSILEHDPYYDSETKTCFPSGFTNYLPQYLWSPGVCPSNYFTVSTSIHGTITSAGCCFRCVSLIRIVLYKLKSPVNNSGFGAESSAFSQGQCLSIFYQPTTAVSVDPTANKTVTTVVSSGTARRDAYFVAYASSDLSLFGPQTSIYSIPTPTDTNPVPTSNSLGTGAKAGIGIGAGTFVLLLLGAIYMIVRYQRKHLRDTKGEDKDIDGTAELKGNPVNELGDGPFVTAELKGNPVSEIGSIDPTDAARSRNTNATVRPTHVAINQGEPVELSSS